MPSVTIISAVRISSTPPSKRIYTDGKEVRIKGDLTIRGVTREVELQLDGPVQQIKDASGNTRMGASAKTRISRKDFGLTWNKLLESGGAVVGDEVTVVLDIAAVRKAQ